MNKDCKTKTKEEQKKLSALIEKLKKEWNIDEMAKRGAFFINNPESLLDAKLISQK
ncbi:hypothetical protein [uncultured Parabacteroides sp.]|uniref:hypothetical protein n=1 Tax=uncultured Parabacteroides sp. TaxID=512312 RepID=UPI00261C0ABC|nr:hypothetical protein [uncultured Parabacteroides sp.]